MDWKTRYCLKNAVAITASCFNLIKYSKMLQIMLNHRQFVDILETM